MKGRATVTPAPLSPLGTARQRLAPASAYPAVLAAELADADLGEEALFLAWQLAAWAEPALRESFLAIVARSLVALAAGSTRLPLDPEARAVCAGVPALVGGPGARTPLVLEDGHLYHQKLWTCEERLVAGVRARLARPAPFDPAAIEAAVAATMATAVPRPNAEQERAVRTALERRITVVSGGPGTGKTTIVVAIARALVRAGLSPSALALAAPTGKAANRLEEAVKAGLARLPSRTRQDEALLASLPPAETLHRLLGYAPSSATFHHHENNRLAAKVVIVDEGSMIDLVLMDRLIRALSDDAMLVLLGDADQLPSVEAGAVFRDLEPLAVTLTRSHRMDPSDAEGRRILEVARAVRGGDGASIGALVAERASADELAFSAVELVPGSAREALLERWYDERIAAAADFSRLCGHVHLLRGGAFASEGDLAVLESLAAHHARRRILCATRGRPTGAEAVNAWLHARHGADGAAPVAGEPVMILRNDYDRGLWNGDQGIVVRVAGEGGRGPRLAAAFRTRAGWAAFDLATLRETLTLAYAMTVHKAQGSEFDEVAFLLPDAPLPILSRELVYTAVTRSRRAVVLCGTAALLTDAAGRSVARASGIAERLRRVRP